MTGSAVPAASSSAVATSSRLAPPESVVHTIRPSAGPGGHPRHDLQPVRVGVRPDEARGPGGQVDRQQAHLALVPALHDDQRCLRGRAVPGDGDQVRKRGPVPADLGQPAIRRAQAPGQAGQQQRDIGVGRAGHRVADLRGRAVRISGIGDVPALDRALIDPGDQQRGTIRRPPVAAHAAHLLGSDKFRDSERDVRRSSRLSDGLVVAAGQVGDPERAAVQVGQAPAGRVGPRISRRRGCRHRADRRRGQVGHVHLAGQDERGHLQLLVGGEPDDAPGPLPGPFPAGLLGRVQLLGTRADLRRVGDQVLLAGARRRSTTGS